MPVSDDEPRNCGHAFGGRSRRPAPACACAKRSAARCQRRAATRNSRRCKYSIDLHWFYFFSCAPSCERVQLIAIHDEQLAVGRHRGRIDGAAHVLLRHQLERLAVLDHGDVAVLVAEVDLVADQHRRAPDRREHVVRPVRLAGLEIEAVQEAAEVGEVDQAVLDRRGRDRSADLVEVPDACRSA